MSEIAAKPRGLEAADLAYIAVFAALLAALSPLAPIPLGPVPVSLQTLIIAITGLCLGPLRAFLAVGLYVVLGAAGLPIFANGAAGLAPILGPTGGYILSFPLAALVTGLVARWALRNGLTKYTGLWFFGGLLVSRYLVIFPLGVAGLMRALGMSLGEAVAIDAAFWLIDLAKSVVAMLLALAVHRAFPRLMRR